ncbi:hypothetical protein Nepgr_029043 [Nepenthes gracilis]|uniref:Uncharacterized protein n=1 Tax=Nepenthes gracilis TaxID=150966 RepID=A0AAD3TBP3_NEPGR|nr:hypothetical protein Nepgr_029043 [Nepenthes gracilis]
MDDHERREATIASSPCLRPNFSNPGVTKNQLNKFQELHKRRLQIKSKFKNKKKPKDGLAKFKVDDHDEKDCLVENANQMMRDSNVAGTKSSDSKDNSSLPHVDINHALKKRQKLHWGLDTKERWERKANM